MSENAMSRFTALPCGVAFDGLKGECCATNCRERAVRAEKDPILRHRAVDACRYWAMGEAKGTGAGKKTAAKPRRK